MSPSAATGLRALEARALTARISRGVAIALLIIGALVLAYCGGESRGVARVDTDVSSRLRRALADSSKLIEQRMAARIVVIHKTDTIAARAMSAHTAAAARIAIVDDSTARIDDGPPVHVIPAAIAIPEIQTCNAAIPAIAIHDTAVAAQLDDMTRDRDLQRARADTAEAQLARATPPRFGFRSGIVVGASAIALLVHLLR